MFKVTRKLKLIKQDLKQLNKEGFCSIEDERKRLHQDFLQAQNGMHKHPGDEALAAIENEASASYKLAHECYLSFLQQTAKIRWLELGY